VLVPVPPSQVLVALEAASANKSLKRVHSTADTLAKVSRSAPKHGEYRRGVEFARLSGDADCICAYAGWLCNRGEYDLALEMSSPFVDDPSDYARGAALYIRALAVQQP
jgi:hypothetical protein